MASEELKREIKQMIVSALDLTYVEPDAIDESIPIFENDALKLDSVDGLELVVAIQRDYGARIDSQNLARSVLYSIESIADFVEANRRDGR